MKRKFAYLSCFILIFAVHIGWKSFVLYSQDIYSTPVSVLPQKITLDEEILREKIFTAKPENISVFCDSTKSLSFSKAQAVFYSGAFRVLDSSMLPLLPHAAYWLCFEVHNTLISQTEWVIHFGENAARAAGRNSYYDLYAVRNGNLVQEKHSGFHRPAHERDLPSHHNAVEITLPTNHSTLIFVRLERLYGFSPNPTLHIFTPIEFERSLAAQKNLHNALSFFLLGTFVVMGLFYGIYAFIIRDLTYLYYVLYVIGSCSLFAYLLGIFHSHLFPEYPLLENHFFFWGLMLGAVEPVFVRSFLKLETFMPRWAKVLDAAFVMEFAAALLCYGAWVIWGNFPIVNAVLTFMTAAVVLCQFILSFVLMRSERRLVRYVVLANFLLYGANLLFLLFVLLPRYFGLQAPLDFSVGVYVACAGASGRIALFALGFGYRSKMLEAERLQAQDDFIRQLQRNEELQRIQNQELESKVRERTVELETTNEQLLEANTEIERQLIILEEQAAEIEVRNAEMHEVNQALSEANEFKMKMLGIAAHDLKNPISNILLSSQLLKKKMGNEISIEYTNSIQESSEQMLSIIDDLLESSKMGLGKVKLDVRSFDCVKTVYAVCEQYARVIQVKKQELQLQMPETCMIQADEGRVRQVVDNLLSNASKYSPLGGKISISLQIICPYGAELVQISVQDSGPGISVEDRTNLFGMFQRLSAKPTGGETSSGVGLASVKSIVEMHGGSIQVQGGEQDGSIFIVQLPMIVSV